MTFQKHLLKKLLLILYICISNVIPLSCLPSTNTHCTNPPPCFYETATPPTLLLLNHPILAFLYSGASSFHMTKGLPYAWFHIRPSFAKYATGLMGPSKSILWLVFSPWELWIHSFACKYHKVIVFSS